jgi:GntR family transcriptional regulator, vanillate catabolism transcriptional regulator
MSGVTTQLDQAVVHLRELILRGKLVPGQRVAEAPLAEELGMSRTPVRRALPLLAREGLLTEHETRGYVVRAFTWAEVVDAIDLRGVLEGLLIRRIAEHGASRPFLRELKGCLDEGDAIMRHWNLEGSDEAGYAEMNTRFHTLIRDEAGSSILSEALERNEHVPFAGPQAVAFDRANPEEMFDVLRYAHRQHHAIYQAIERGESARAESLMREHANTVKESIHVADFEVAARESAQRLKLAR